MEPPVILFFHAQPSLQVSAGHSHSAAVTDTGGLYVWGSGVSGKLGLGPITEEFECFAPVPYLLRFPESVSVSGSVDARQLRLPCTC